MSQPEIIYHSRTDATPGTEISALANVYRYLLDSHAQKKAAPESRPDAEKGFKE